MIEQINKLIENEGLTVWKLERLLCLSSGTLNRVINGNCETFSANVLIKIVEKYPQYSCEWLLTGKGPMLKSEVSSEDIAPKQDETELTEQLRLNQKVMLKQIELLESENERLKKELSEQESKRVKFGSSDCSSLVG